MHTDAQRNPSKFSDPARLLFGPDRADASRYPETIAMLLGTAVASLALSSCLAFGQTANPATTPPSEFEAVSI